MNLGESMIVTDAVDSMRILNAVVDVVVQANPGAERMTVRENGTMVVSVITPGGGQVAAFRVQPSTRKGQHEIDGFWRSRP